MFVSRLSFTLGPEVTGFSSTPIPREISFSGIKPTERSSVSHSYSSSVPGIDLPDLSTSARVIPSTLSFPFISITVWLSFSGIPKSSRHCTIFRFNPPEYGISSATTCTSAPSRVILLAMIRPISPDPRITTLRPGRYPSMLTRRCAVPAEKMPAGRYPGILSAPRERSLHPIARITAFAWI